MNKVNEWKNQAAYALGRGRKPQALVLAYAAFSALAAALLVVLDLWLSQEIGDTGGLGNMGIRSMLSTAQAVLPLAQMVVTLGLEFGFLHGLLRICRGQYADATDLKVGIQRFFPALRLMVLQGFVYFGIAFFAYQLAMCIYMLTPWAEALAALTLPLQEQVTILDPTVMMTDEFLLEAAPLVMPMMVIWAILCCGAMIPASYRLRLSRYALLDNPGAGAMAAMRASVKMTRKNCVNLFKLDLSYWWYYVLGVLASLLAYLDVLLSMVNIQLPLGDLAAFILFFALFLGADFARTYFLRNKVECSYIMAYAALCEKPKDNGVVLGNIFEM